MVTLGRGATCDVRLDDPAMADEHARLHLGAEISIEDLGSPAGTRMGARLLRPNETASISPGVPVVLGTTTFVILSSHSSTRMHAPLRAAYEQELPSDDGLVRGGAIDRLRPLIDRVAASAISVLIEGETGVGKDVVARLIHRRSPRARAPFYAMNCAAVSETLLESELLGYERGAFTGATASKPGLLESADGGTVFLDEVGEMPSSVQAKLLRVLEEREVLRLGSVRPRKIDVRFIAATNRDLEEEIALGNFRSDLFFRLNGISIVVPPLRERPNEIEPLALGFLTRAAQLAGREAPRLSAEAAELLRAYVWPGNVRELKNVIERAIVLATGSVIEVAHLPADKMSRALTPAPRAVAPRRPSTLPPPPDEGPASHRKDRSFDEAADRERIMRALEQCGGNQSEAAKLLGIARRTLINRIEQYALPRPRRKPPTGS
jgi:transcriptional regulator with PAS, ATPase and Fis domain